MGWCQSNGLDAFVTSKDLLKIVTRDIKIPAEDADEDTKEEFHRLIKIFAFYWDSLLPPAAHASKWWKPMIRHNQVISKATFDGVECVPAAAEAFTFLVCENMEDRWYKGFQQSDIGRAKGWQFPKKKEDLRTEELKAKYTASDKGAVKYGGYNSAGRRRYNQVKKLIEDARRDQPRVEELEALVLQKVHANNDLGNGEPDPEACNGRKRKKTDLYDDMVDCD